MKPGGDNSGARPRRWIYRRFGFTSACRRDSCMRLSEAFNCAKLSFAVALPDRTLWTAFQNSLLTWLYWRR